MFQNHSFCDFGDWMDSETILSRSTSIPLGSTGGLRF